jgi:hypothetical protein
MMFGNATADPLTPALSRIARGSGGIGGPVLRIRERVERLRPLTRLRKRVGAKLNGAARTLCSVFIGDRAGA